MIIDLKNDKKIVPVEELSKADIVCFNGHIGHYHFIVPDHITDNQKKLVYKIGFLKTLYALAYEDLSNVEQFKELDKDWQIFKSVRQMERLYRQYKELKEKGEI